MDQLDRCLGLRLEIASISGKFVDFTALLSDAKHHVELMIEMLIHTYLIFHDGLLESRSTHCPLSRLLTPTPRLTTIRRLHLPLFLAILGQFLQRSVSETHS